MNIPNFIDSKIVEANGLLTAGWKFLFMQLFDQMHKNLSNEGFVIPSLPTTKIDKLSKSIDGTLIYDSTLGVLKIKQNGSFNIISTT